MLFSVLKDIHAMLGDVLYDEGNCVILNLIEVCVLLLCTVILFVSYTEGDQEHQKEPF